MKREQKESTGIANSIEDDIVNGKAYNGYVKLCGTWVRRFWMPELETDNSNFQVLNEPTKIFDACGAIDGDESVPYGSDHEPWNNAVNFFNWYGIPDLSIASIILLTCFDTDAPSLPSADVGNILNSNKTLNKYFKGIIPPMKKLNK